MQKTHQKSAIITKKPKNKGGRPTKYTKELANFICQLVSTFPYGLSKICYNREDLPHESTIRQWRLDNPEFSAQYARAKLIQADILAEDCLDISDQSTAETYCADRLKIETRKWLASKLLPKQYGDRVVLEQKTEENEQLKAELIALRAKLDEENKREF